jgi:metal-responsive CopG/Arc/MetJ family transcriptional regulator
MAKEIVTAEFPGELAHQARIAAAVAGISRSELIRQAVAEYLEKMDSAGPEDQGEVQKALATPVATPA